jgi:mRNA-degrading endonuclease RelE of RelBE toxin-antitoxin system
LFVIGIHRKSREFLENLPEKLKNNVRDVLLTLREDLYPRESKLITLPGGYRVYRLHISHLFTVFYAVDSDKKRIYIVKIMTIEQTHKEYRRWG